MSLFSVVMIVQKNCSEKKFKCGLKQNKHYWSLPAFSQKQPVESQNEGLAAWAVIGFLSVFL